MSLNDDGGKVSNWGKRGRPGKPRDDVQALKEGGAFRSWTSSTMEVKQMGDFC